MANQSKLKAWVRYDGTGRVISGGPIFQVNKPKVGNWRQIDANLCCNSTLTTTTTQGGGGATPTAFITQYWVSVENACNQAWPQGTLLFYSASSMITSGVTVFSNASLTTPVTEGFVVQGGIYGMNRYSVGAGGVLSELTCPELTTTTTTTQALTFYNADYQFGGVGNPCNDTGQFNIPLVVDQGLNPCGGAIVTLANGTWASYGINPGATILVNFGAQGTPGTVLVLLVYGTNSSTNNGCTSCG